jgi:hypothetical protein
VLAPRTRISFSIRVEKQLWIHFSNFTRKDYVDIVIVFDKTANPTSQILYGFLQKHDSK